MTQAEVIAATFIVQRRLEHRLCEVAWLEPGDLARRIGFSETDPASLWLAVQQRGRRLRSRPHAHHRL
jgi:hypothetical protein